MCVIILACLVALEGEGDGGGEGWRPSQKEKYMKGKGIREGRAEQTGGI